MTVGTYRVLLVDDSPLDTALLRRLLADADDIEIVGEASDGFAALQAIKDLDPDVVCADYLMPKMDGLELVRRVMGETPRPILIVSAFVQQSADAVELLNEGAAGFFPKPKHINLRRNAVADEFARTIRAVAGTRMDGDSSVVPSKPVATGDYGVIAVGASAGGPDATQLVLNELSANYPIPIVLTQHISAEFTTGYADWLSKRTPFDVRVAESGNHLEPGVVLLAPHDRHLELQVGRRVELTLAAPVESCRPSITVMFESVAARFRNRAVGVLLTGMGSDGSRGMKAIHDAGGLTIAQSEQTCAVAQMPGAAVAEKSVRHILSPQGVGRLLLRTADAGQSKSERATRKSEG